MKKLFVTLLAVVCMAPAMALADHHEAEEGKEEMAKEEMAADPMAQMQAWLEANEPGAEHEVLQRLVGDWTYTTSGEMGESSGTMHAESIFDGRYVLHHWKGSFMDMDFVGHGVDGYDNAHGKYVSGWIDNMSTGVMTSHGKCSDDDCTELVTWSKHPGPDGEMMKTKSVTTWDGPDSFTMTMYMVPEEGEPVQHMQIVGTRAEGEEAHAKVEAAEAEMAEAEAEMAEAEAEAEMAEAEAAADEAMAEAAEVEAEAEEAVEAADEAMAEAEAVMKEADAVMDEASDEAEAMTEDDE